MSTNKLKLIAFITMIIDHISIIYPDIPVWFRWIGRISAPLFIFCAVWSFSYTHNKKNYLLRLYISSIIMSFIDCFFSIGNNIFRLLFSIILVLYIIEICKGKNSKKYILFYLIYQISIIIILNIIFNIAQKYNLTLINSINHFIIPSITGSILNLEFGYIFVILGIIIYFCKDNKKDLITYYSYFCLFYLWITTSSFLAYLHKLPTFIPYLFDKVIGFSTRYMGLSMFRVNYQWMMIFALPFMLSYNHKKGHNWKWFYYIAYPIHIILFTLIRKCLFKY